LAKSDFKAKLKAAKKKWKKARKEAEDSSGFAEFEDGRYIAKLTKAEFGESKTSERLQIAWGWTFQEGDYEGQTTFDYDGCETDDNLVWVGRKFARLGYEIPEDFDDIPEALEEIVADGVVARIVLKTSGEYQNIQIQKVLDAEDGEEFEEEPEDDEELEEEETDSDDDDEEEEESEDSDDDDEEEEEDDEEELEEDDEEEEVPEEPKVKRRKPKGGKKKGRR
jgi:hypothetical protein